MKLKFGMLLAGLAVIAASFGIVGAASAEEPAIAGEVDAAYFFGPDHDLPRWLRYSIVYCAAKTMDLEVDQVKLGLRHGHSLKEIGIRAGVRPVALENGILRCEQHLLLRLINAGELDPPEARRIFNFLSEHITRIINYTWNPVDATAGAE